MKNELGLIEKKNNVGGIPFTYFENRHTGKNLVLLHGLLDASFGFRRIIPYLSSEWKIFIPDIPGFGKNKLPKISFLLHLDIISKMIYEWFRILNLNDVVLVGHSMGGLLSQHIALQDKREDNRIKKLILLAPGNSPHPKRDEMRSLLFPSNRSEVIRLLHQLYQKDFPDPSPFMQDVLIHAWSSPTYNILTYNTIQRENEIFFGNKVKNIQIPTHLIVGENDKITEISEIKKMNKWIPNSTMDIIKNAKHAIHLEFPLEVAEHINKKGLEG